MIDSWQHHYDFEKGASIGCWNKRTIKFLVKKTGKSKDDLIKMLKDICELESQLKWVDDFNYRVCKEHPEDWHKKTITYEDIIE